MGILPAFILGFAIVLGANDIAKAIRVAQINVVIKAGDETPKPAGKVQI